MVVLDASGSMNQTDAPGPRIDAAKSRRHQPDRQPAGRRPRSDCRSTAPGPVPPTPRRQAGCTDIKTLAPVGPLDAAALKAQVATVVASGYTPIGNALRAAADALPNEGPRSIVLVSDGEDTCAPPAPCDVANELTNRASTWSSTPSGSRSTPPPGTNCPASPRPPAAPTATPPTPTALTQALATKVDYAITGYTTVGTPVTGADQASEQAPLLTPGQYVDTYASRRSE